jgi:hypothetical protein
MKNKILFLTIMLIAGIIVSGCSKSTNIFGWTHKEGGSKSPSVLAADADSAYSNGNYAVAMDYYKDAVAQSGGVANSPNSTARVGYVKSYLKNMGLDLADLMKNASGQQTNISIPGGDKIVQYASYSGAVYYFVEIKKDSRGNDVIYGVNIKDFENLIKVIIDYLEPITVEGKCDGKIPATNPVLNINLAFAHLFRGIIYVVDYGYDGKLDYNVRHNDDNSMDLVTEPGHIRVALSVNLPGINDGLRELDISISKLETAKRWSKNSESKLWGDVHEILKNVNYISWLRWQYLAPASLFQRALLLRLWQVYGLWGWAGHLQRLQMITTCFFTIPQV